MEVNVTKRIETPSGSRYCPVVLNSSGRIKSDWVIVNGNQEKHPEGSYYLEWREKGQRKRLSVGKDAVVAFNSQVRKVKELEARAEGLEVQLPKDDPNRAHLRSAMAEFLKEIKLSRKDKTWRGYKVAFAYFQQSCSKKCAEELERIDLLEFVAFLREKKKLAPRTVFNKFTCVMTFLESQGIPKLLGKNDKPRFVETEVAIFEDNQLTDLYPVCTLYHRTLYDFLLMTGFREQEAMHITWQNIRFKANIVEMRWKPQFGWSPKAYKEREVPVPDELLESLEVYRKTLSEKRAASGALVFSTRSGKCDTHMIRALKRNATKARLNPNDFWLHKFRSTFATTHLRAGVDLKTVMAWMGQTTMDSIIRYLKPARKDEVISKVKPEQAERFIHEMVALKLIEPTTAFNKEAAYEVGDLGIAFANATATKPIYRETAERVLKEFMERVDTVNASKEYAFRIRGVVLFGSMLSSADRVGDVDVAVDLQPSISDSHRFKRLCDRRRNLAQGRGRSLCTAMDWALWPQKEVVLHLKARSHYLSLHGFDQFMEMENFCYRVLIGDSKLIASQIPTGRLCDSPPKSKHSAVNRRVVGSSPT